MEGEPRTARPSPGSLFLRPAIRLVRSKLLSNTPVVSITKLSCCRSSSLRITAPPASPAERAGAPSLLRGAHTRLQWRPALQCAWRRSRAARECCSVSRRMLPSRRRANTFRARYLPSCQCHRKAGWPPGCFVAVSAGFWRQVSAEGPARDGRRFRAAGCGGCRCILQSCLDVP